MTGDKPLTKAAGSKQQVDDSVYVRVDDGHIVPATYQRNFAAGKQVLMHQVGSNADPELRNVSSVCTRGPFYRRERSDGTLIDDTEHIMAQVESQAGICFKRIREIGAPQRSDRGTLANFFGLQLMRSPTFFAVRAQTITAGLDEAPVDQFKAKAVEEQGAEAVRRLATQILTGSTASTRSMLGLATKSAAVLANMHWTLLTFEDPVLAYSDHPVVVWPAQVPLANSFRGQQTPLMEAVEIRMPLTAKIFLLLTWRDGPDFQALTMGRPWAGELNQLTIGQAEREWAHMPGTRPPVAQMGHEPLSPRLWPAYSPDTMHQALRHQFVRQLLRRHQDADHIQTFDLLRFADSPAPAVRPSDQRSKRRRKKGKRR